VVLGKHGENRLDRSCDSEVLHRHNEESNVIRTITRRKYGLVGHILRDKCLQKQDS
jgi:hypothetical protein